MRKLETSTGGMFFSVKVSRKGVWFLSTDSKVRIPFLSTDSKARGCGSKLQESACGRIYTKMSGEKETTAWDAYWERLEAVGSKQSSYKGNMCIRDVVGESEERGEDEDDNGSKDMLTEEEMKYMRMIIITGRRAQSLVLSLIPSLCSLVLCF